MSRGIIVLEGPDHAGKTTLAREIMRQEPRARYLHLTYRWPQKMDLYHFAAIRWAIKHSKDRIVIIDRWWPSEEIYAHVYRGGTSWPLWGRMLNRLMLKKAGIYVLCDPNKQWCLEGHAARRDKGQEYYDEIEEVIELYHDLAAGNQLSNVVGYSGDLMRDTGVKLRANWLVYRPPNHDPIDFARLTLKKLHVHRWWNYDNETLAGRYIMVGDVLKPKYHGHVYPFIDHSNSSLYLAQAMRDARVEEEHFVWCNIHKEPGVVDPDVITWLNETTLTPVLFGKNAQRSYRKHVGTTKNTVLLHHPQYYRRFNHHSAELTAELIKLR